MSDSPLTNDLIEAIASRLDLRLPNKEALQTLAFEMDRHFGEDGGSAPWEAVIDAATGMGKTFILAAALDYYAALGTRNFAVIAPGRTILEKTVANFTPGHRKSVLGGMETEPVVITSENFASPAMRAVMDDPERVKLFIFTVQSLLRPTSKAGRKTHKFQEGLGRAFYEHLDAQDDLLVFADEHHVYHAPAFSRAIRDLTPHALIGLTATPNERALERDGIPIIYRYPLAAAIANEYVKTPVIVGRKDDLSDARTKLADGLRLLEAKEQSIAAYCAETGDAPVAPVMLVVAQSIDDANEFGELLNDGSFMEGRYGGDKVLVVHSDSPDESLAALELVEEPESPVRVIVSVGMLKEGWDVKSVYVIVSMRASISDVLTEQTLGRGLRLPFGSYTGWELLDSLEVIAHERYEDLLKKANVINEAFIDYRTRAVERKNAKGETVVTIEKEPVQVEVAPTEDGAAAAPPGTPVLESVEGREKDAEAEVEAAKTELEMIEGRPAIEIPVLKLSPVENKWSLNDITNYDAFEKLGRSIAADPATELRRIKLKAHVITGADGIRRTELDPTSTIDAIEAQPSLLPLEESKTKLAEGLLAAPVVPARAGERPAAGKIIDAFVDGLGDQAETVLGGYLDRALAGLIELVTTEQRGFGGKAGFEQTVETKTFAATRKARPETSTDRIGKFARRVGYLGYTKAYYQQEWFDSSTERTLANLLDDADEVAAWLRLQRGDLEIQWEGGTYNPDFIAIDSDGVRWVVEVKSDRDMPTETVQSKRQAAKRWANHVTSSDAVDVEWRYLLASESDIAGAKGSWSALRASSA